MENILNHCLITGGSGMVGSNIHFGYKPTSFEMDIENELACVVFDEIHMINDQARGHVWEQSIMMLPKQVQMIGLSATLDNPEKFALWLENKGEFNPNPKKIKDALKKIIKEGATAKIELVNGKKYLFFPFSISKENFLGYDVDLVCGATLTTKGLVKKATGFFIPLINSVEMLESN